jgi:hypothetical protein
MSTEGYVYATRMPTGNIKVGMGRNAKRAEAGKTFGPIEVLKILKVADRRVAEKLARSVTAHLRVGKRELFKSTGEQIVALIDRVLASRAESYYRPHGWLKQLIRRGLLRRALGNRSQRTRNRKVVILDHL